mmetsp:Transcript_23868/g.68286  ORF Transcript_23868/g.68286 Transcript_23868/m.68286 type:complete len:429 (+) Transcript_23868:411-1697(+)
MTPRMPARMTAGETLPPYIAALLMDSTRARRWRQKFRLVLNDRRILSDVTPPPSSLSERLLERALAFGEEPSTNELTAFIDTTCQLKAVRFGGWKQEELLAFWLNIYHCLLLHGWLLLGTPRSKSELHRFHNRVSYLVGMRPVSLREIERIILHVPRADPQEAVRAQARARARQLLGFVSCCCRRRAKGQRISGASSDDGSTSQRSSERGSASRSSAAGVAPCLPMVNLPRPYFMPQTGAHACLFLDKGPESSTTGVPKQDLRALFILNRCNKSSMKGIPIFHIGRLNGELDDIARQFAAIFVEVHERDGRVIKATLPWCCQSIKQQLVGNPNPQALLHFVWNFMPEGPKPFTGTQVKFLKNQEEMRKRVDMVKAVYTDPSFNVPPPSEVAPTSPKKPPAEAGGSTPSSKGPIVEGEVVPQDSNTMTI